MRKRIRVTMKGVVLAAPTVNDAKPDTKPEIPKPAKKPAAKKKKWWGKSDD